MNLAFSLVYWSSHLDSCLIQGPKVYASQTKCTTMFQSSTVSRSFYRRNKRKILYCTSTIHTNDSAIKLLKSVLPKVRLQCAFTYWRACTH